MTWHRRVWLHRRAVCSICTWSLTHCGGGWAWVDRLLWTYTVVRYGHLSAWWQAPLEHSYPWTHAQVRWDVPLPGHRQRLWRLP